MPIRIKLERRRGYRMPPGAIKVDRSTPFGNPFKTSECRAAGFMGDKVQLAKRCCEAFRAWLTHPHGRENWSGPEADAARARILELLPTLRGKDLACWCPLGGHCHADVLIELANAPESINTAPKETP